MVTSTTPNRCLARDLDWQDVASSLSRVRPVSCPVDPMRRHVRPEAAFHAADAATADRLEKLQWLLEWAYGYRAPKDARQRFTRRAPSAGGLYPTENFVVLQDGRGWHVLYYHYPTHQFYRAVGADGAAAAAQLGLALGTQAVLFASVLWRAIQRYGVRGYRYCLLDAGNVASNLAHAASAFLQTVDLDCWSPSEGLEAALGLEYGEALLLGLRCRPIPAPRPLPPVLTELPQPPAARIEHPPLFSPLLRRAVAFHRRTLCGPGDRQVVRWDVPSLSPQELRDLADERYSPRDFTGEAMSRAQYEAMANVVRRTRPALSDHAAAIRAYALTTRVDGLPVGVGPVDDDRAPESSPFGATAAALGQRLSEACQNQAIMKPAAFTFVLAARKEDLLAHGHRGYRPLILNAGFLCADLYREAARCGLGTTSIGGFSDDAVAGLLGDAGLAPLVIQAFGVPCRRADKVDAARIVGTKRNLLCG